MLLITVIDTTSIYANIVGETVRGNCPNRPTYSWCILSALQYITLTHPAIKITHKHGGIVIPELFEIKCDYRQRKTSEYDPELGYD